MKRIITGGVAFGLIALAGCGSAAGKPAHSPPAAALPSHAPTAAAASAASRVSAHERLFADTLANNHELSSRSAVAGPAMQAYLRHQALEVEADAAAGTQDPAGTVSSIPGGYRICWPDGSGNTSCQSFTGFRVNHAGRITDLTVDGQLISDRLAVGTDTAGSQLSISSVSSYRPANLGKVIVTFKVRNITSHVVGNGNPAFLAVLDAAGGVQFNEDDNYSVLPGNLQPAESAAAYAVFDTHAVAGRFSLRSNDGYMSVLAATTLHRPGFRPRPHSHSRPAASAPPSAPAASLGCKVLQTGTKEEFNVTTVGSGSYSGTIYVSFYDYAGSGDVFPGTTVPGATPVGVWRPVPAADIGASAEPTGCTASTG